MQTIIEPFRIKMTEALPITTRKLRQARLASANYNVFLLNAEDITIDLLTGSGADFSGDSPKAWGPGPKQQSFRHHPRKYRIRRRPGRRSPDGGREGSLLRQA